MHGHARNWLTEWLKFLVVFTFGKLESRIPHGENFLLTISLFCGKRFLWNHWAIRDFYKDTTLAIMPKLASEALLNKNKKIQWQNVTKWWLNLGLWLTSDSKSNTLLSELIWHVLLRGSLKFCLCTTWFVDSHDLVGINIVWL